MYVCMYLPIHIILYYTIHIIYDVHTYAISYYTTSYCIILILLYTIDNTYYSILNYTIHIICHIQVDYYPHNMKEETVQPIYEQSLYNTYTTLTQPTTTYTHIDISEPGTYLQVYK